MGVLSRRDRDLSRTLPPNRQITHILENTAQEYPAVGTLTASNRDVWAKVSIPDVYNALFPELSLRTTSTSVPTPTMPTLLIPFTPRRS